MSWIKYDVLISSRELEKLVGSLELHNLINLYITSYQVLLFLFVN